MSHGFKPVSSELLEQMCVSKHVKIRDEGVIARFLVTMTELDPIRAARGLIKAQIDAGLVTFLQDDLGRHIDDIVAAKLKKAQDNDL